MYKIYKTIQHLMNANSHTPTPIIGLIPKFKDTNLRTCYFLLTIYFLKK
jgi:hypothetical protein